MRKALEQIKGWQESTHSSGTNAFTLGFKSLSALEAARTEIKKNPNISMYYVQPDHLKEVSNAIEYGDYFKAFTLCNSLYESLGKNILVKYFKGQISLNSDRLEKLTIQSVIMMLYTHRLVEEGTYSDMISVNSIRNTLVHQYKTTLSDEILESIKENKPKIMRSLNILDQKSKEQMKDT